jgi:flagellin FlaB
LCFCLYGGSTSYVPCELYDDVRTSSMPFRRFRTNLNADIGIGALIIFIAMILVAGITASVMIQTMSSLQERAVQTSQDTLKDISSGVKVSHISGYVQNASITQLAIFVSTIAASDSIDLTYGMLTLSDSTTKVILNYSSTCFSLLVIRDIDGSCTAANPVIDNEDIVVILVNTTACFSGIGPRTEVSGELYPEHGLRGSIGFTTPSTFVHTIVDLQP